MTVVLVECPLEPVDYDSIGPGKPHYQSQLLVYNQGYVLERWWKLEDFQWMERPLLHNPVCNALAQIYQLFNQVDENKRLYRHQSDFRLEFDENQGFRWSVKPKLGSSILLRDGRKVFVRLFSWIETAIQEQFKHFIIKKGQLGEETLPLHTLVDVLIDSAWVKNVIRYDQPSKTLMITFAYVVILKDQIDKYGEIASFLAKLSADQTNIVCLAKKANDKTFESSSVRVQTRCLTVYELFRDIFQTAQTTTQKALQNTLFFNDEMRSQALGCFNESNYSACFELVSSALKQYCDQNISQWQLDLKHILERVQEALQEKNKTESEEHQYIIASLSGSEVQWHKIKILIDDFSTTIRLAEFS